MKWLKRIAIGLGSLIVLAVVVGACWEMITRFQVARAYPPQGRLVDIGGRRIQLDCRGSGTPVVVLEAGLDMFGSLSWAAVHDSIASTSRTCAYSRAGIMWSDPSDGVHNGTTVAADLHGVLTKGGEKSPFVMVGHSLGGPYIMTFTKDYPTDVAGLVFVDASHPDQVERFRQATGKENSASKVMLMFNIASALSWTGAVRLIANRESGPPTTPDPATKAMRSYMPTSLSSMLKEWKSLDSTMAEAGTFRELSDRPLVVLTAMAPYPDDALKSMELNREQADRMQATWRELHDEEATWSRKSRHELVPNATHYIQFDRPDVVIQAVREVVDSVRAK